MINLLNKSLAVELYRYFKNLGKKAVTKQAFLYPPNTGRADTQESLNRNVGKSRENQCFEGVLEGF
ncbi:hypothetical protein LEP1GSC133_0732 [Leptospira borgpetersenii serovar Pomona str. 200901868]|uniref:Uncharacterized protein n=1 Tax=Leptospira borgpetersenii serovar Pomona str. 200901868 TaxID=1192866 RepID=M6W7N5_LEPBO|nr:hypothetical protein LEP1GSC133_0732 [Leptospira borgpetersenii serovar Pomona str. 200901868]